MSGLDGDALLAIIRAWKPHIFALVISGSIHPYPKEVYRPRGFQFYCKTFCKD